MFICAFCRGLFHINGHIKSLIHACTCLCSRTDFICIQQFIGVIKHGKVDQSQTFDMQRFSCILGSICPPYIIFYETVVQILKRVLTVSLPVSFLGPADVHPATLLYQPTNMKVSEFTLFV